MPSLNNISSGKTETITFGTTKSKVSNNKVGSVEVTKDLTDYTQGEVEFNNKLVAKEMHVMPNGVFYTSGWEGQIIRYDPTVSALQSRFKAVGTPPCVPDRQHWNRLDEIIEHDGKLYMGTSDGYIFRFDPSTNGIENFVKPIRAIDVMGLTFSTLDGRLYGINGGDEEGISRFWCLDTEKGIFDVDYPAVKVFNRKPMGDIVCLKNGTIVMTETERVANLWVLTPGEKKPYKINEATPPSNPRDVNLKKPNIFVGHKKLEVDVYPIPSAMHGGYVWRHLSDFSRRWGELEAYKTQIWIQGDGTVGMGNVFLDSYHATGNEYYYRAAEKAAEALIWGQLPSGGWNYVVDFAGDRSLKEWYNTIGKNAWGFEEFNHYYGNATFDDNTTIDAAKFLLRIYLQKLDIRFKPALDKAIEFTLESQYPLGGWPQRYPLKYDFPHGGLPDYTSFYTFNDDVISGNIDFLIQCYMTLGGERFLGPIQRGMNFYLITQQGNPQGGWGDQYNMKLEPASARSYEPAALLTSSTYNNAMLLLRFYEYTGDRKFLARVPDAIQWIESSRLPKNETEDGRKTHPMFVEVGTNKAIYSHRRGSGVTDGHYWVDYKDENPLLHYGAKSYIDIELLKKEYERINALSPEEATKNSPLKVERFRSDNTPQSYYDVSKGSSGEAPDESKVRAVINSLGDQNCWLTKHEWNSRPYSVSKTGEETNTAGLSTEGGARILDSSDQQYITTREYIRNMELLINYIKQSKN